MASFREEVLSKWGGVSLLINNAGVVSANNLSDSAWEELELVVNVNLWGVINCTKMFMPDLIDQKEAFCVNVSSLEGFLAIPGDVAYCTAKFAVRGFRYVFFWNEIDRGMRLTFERINTARRS